MKHTIKLPKPRTENGFVLVTSLIFLVVITLLAVSAISSSTLQERMASNLREKSQARQAADAALRAAELRLSPAVTPDLQTRACSFDANSGNNDSANNPNTLVVCQARVFDGNSGADYFDPAIWDSGSAAIQTYSPPAAAGGSSTPAPTVRYVIEDVEDCENSVNPERCAGADGDGSIRYRITAFARGANPAAIAVTQSIYERTPR
ncbi:PilX N-terminal domain-containing pilus assembly protein [uncultured Salinisphaera sp.]|uniref:pilus assembly PilX family protein n=1 Tax=uncultured Salinisphaera sp. TaxID=359372 RepID=UPI0032B2E06D